MRSQTPFPLTGKSTLILCEFLHTAWTSGWLDEYSENHFLIKAIENRLSTFVGKEQLIENNIDSFGIVNPDKSINQSSFSLNFCINFSRKMQFMEKTFGTEHIKEFMMNQMSAGKKNYDEDIFFVSPQS